MHHQPVKENYCVQDANLLHNYYSKRCDESVVFVITWLTFHKRFALIINREIRSA